MREEWTAEEEYAPGPADGAVEPEDIWNGEEGDKEIPEDASIQDAVNAYLKDIYGKYALLSPEEELDLALRYRRGDSGAGKKLVESNLRLAYALARRYSSSRQELPDLIQEANLGLCNAVERYDPESGKRFSTLAGWCMLGRIYAFKYRNTGSIRMPTGVLELQRKARDAGDMFRLEKGRSPSAHELAQELGVKEKRLREVMERSYRYISLQSDSSPDSSQSGKDPVTLEECVPDTGAARPEDAVWSEQVTVCLRRLVDELPRPDRDIITRVYGLGGTDTENMADIGRSYGVSRERIRFIKNRALRTLKARGGEELKSLFDCC